MSRLRLAAALLALLLPAAARAGCVADAVGESMISSAGQPYACSAGREGECYNDTVLHQIQKCTSLVWVGISALPTATATVTPAPSPTVQPSPTVAVHGVEVSVTMTSGDGVYVTTVTGQAWVTASSIIMCGPFGTTSDGLTLEQTRVSMLFATVSNRVAGTGFDVSVVGAAGAYGTYRIHCVGV